MAAAALLALHVLAVRTETVNWDEFGLLAKARNALRTGNVTGAGRPGLATLAAAPAIGACRDAVAVVRTARYEWIGVTLLMLAGLWALLRIVCRGAEARGLAAALGLSLLVLVPVFQRWSLQVRADQPALAASLWAGVLLLAPRRSPWLAFAGGMLFGVGYLCSQKAVYVGLLVGVLAFGELLVDEAWDTRREELRALGFAFGAAVVVLAYRFGIAVLFTLPPVNDFGTLTSAFAGYRATIGYRPYLGMLPTLVPHLALLAALGGAAWRLRAARTRAARAAALGVAVLAAGVAVGLFHAATFPYFWMTLGLFPAVAVALGLDAILEPFRGRARAAAVTVVFVALLLPTLRAAALLLEDSQASQRAALDFVKRNFPDHARGFHPESALFCREDPAPFPTYFSQDIAYSFYGPDAGSRVAAFISEFRSRPVAFLVGTFRLDQFPPEVRSFWAERYVPYRDNVFVPGRELRGPGGSRIAFDALVAGPYRWLPSQTAGAGCVSIDGIAASPGAPVTLAAGSHDVALSCEARGWLALALREAPGGDARPFWGDAMMRENAGVGGP